MLSPDRPEHLSEATIHYGLYWKKEKEIRKRPAPLLCSHRYLRGQTSPILIELNTAITTLSCMSHVPGARAN